MLKLYAILFIIVLSTSVFAQQTTVSAGITPDNPFYFADVLWDEIKIVLTSDQVSRAQMKFEVAEERLAESEYLLENNPKSTFLANVLEDYNKKTNQTLTDINTLKREGKDTSKLTYITDKLLNHIAVLQDVYDQVPETARPAILNAISKSSATSIEIVSELTPERETEITGAVQPIITANETVGFSGCQNATIDAKTPLVFAGYSIYATMGADNLWARIVIKDSSGQTIDSLIINEGETKTSSVAGLAITLFDIRALQDGTVVGADVKVCKTLRSISLCVNGTADARNPVNAYSHDYFATQGSDNLWGKIVIKARNGTTVDTLIISEGETKTSTKVGTSVTLIDIRALQDGTVLGADLKICLAGRAIGLVKPDLLVRFISFNPPTSAPIGTIVNISADIYNSGNVTAYNFSVDFRHKGPSDTNYYIMGSQRVDSLAPAESIFVVHTWITQSLSAGNHTILVQVDAGNFVDEWNNNNNDRSNTYTLT